MDIDGRDAESHLTPTGTSEYTFGSGSRHRSAGATRRLVFFALTSTWGFIVGVCGVLAAMGAAGQPVHPSLGAITALIPAFIIAAAGGFVIAAAYRESKRRSR
jgi:putative flippase GtrA